MNETTTTGAKYLWVQQAHDVQTVTGIASRFHLSIPVAETLLSRGLKETDEIETFLFTPAERAVSDATLLKDAERAVERIERALVAGEKILIAGDYDVDGVTSAAVMMACLLPLGAKVNFFLPHRQRDGYGLSVKTVQRAAANQYAVIITVDNGISAHEAAREAVARGIDLIITDHHRPHAELPPAYAIVDPHQEDCAYPFKYFAGVGVSFKLMSLLYKRLGKSLPAKVYELLLLGTVADVVPLRGENRYWVRYGLQHINNEVSLPVRLLKQNARLTKDMLTSLDIGFYLAPQINALGRLDDARDAVAFLLGTSLPESERIAHTLATLNAARKEIEQGVVKDVIAQIEMGEIKLADESVIVAVGHSWQPGVVGLAASKLVGMFGRPAIVLHRGSDGMVRGSCRSIPEINIFALLERVKDMLKSFGGHPMAAGVSLAFEDVPLFRQRLHALVSEQVDVSTLRQRLYVDAHVTMPDVTKKLVHDIALLEPFGAEHREPLFRLSQVSLVGEPQLLKDAHLKCMLFSEGVIKPIIFFNRPDLYTKLTKLESTTPFSVVATVTENHWNGKTNIELCGYDIAGI